jgi:hypothetical protein
MMDHMLMSEESGTAWSESITRGQEADNFQLSQARDSYCLRQKLPPTDKLADGRLVRIKREEPLMLLKEGLP